LIHITSALKYDHLCNITTLFKLSSDPFPLKTENDIENMFVYNIKNISAKNIKS